MASSTASGHCFLLALLLLSSAAYGQLSQNFYAKNCSSLDKIIKDEVSRTLFTDPAPLGGRRMGASLLRLFFHDCFVQGCDASVLLDDDVLKGIVSEKNAGPNKNSLRGFEVIDRIKASVEKECPSVVSCADILALATREAVVAVRSRHTHILDVHDIASHHGYAFQPSSSSLQLNGTSWPLLLGRRDSKTANKAQADSDLPSPFSDLDTLITAFGNKKFSPSELAALSGAHTIGMAHCTNVDANQKGRCNTAIDGLAPLDKSTPEMFDNNYYTNLPERGLLHSDQVLTGRPDLSALVGKYSSNQALFFGDFAKAMKKMSEMSVLTGANANGEVRVNCRRRN
ncbi:Cationic peroxidase 1 [Dichanthelium oligosanthes]|uniref:Peroxidase n=1 Tax=Dichanthelium oligosanthes TaxID=888268 RepID=A0A1E5WHK1_9POAL|nr:Cationic peroxidase 1 [Dichanthelium oligosanthes]